MTPVKLLDTLAASAAITLDSTVAEPGMSLPSVPTPPTPAVPEIALP